MVNDSAPSSPKKKKKKCKTKTVHASSEPVIEKPTENPNNVSISDAETQDGEEHEPSTDNDTNDDNNVDNDAPPNYDNEPEKEVEVEPEVDLDDPPPRNKRYDKRDYVARKHGRERTMGTKTHAFS